MFKAIYAQRTVLDWCHVPQHARPINAEVHPIVSGDRSYGDRMASKPTVKRRRLARKLRELRESAGLEQTNVALHTGFSQTKISHIESATVAVSSDDVRTLCEFYGVDPGPTESLATLAREAKKRGWWRTYSDVLTPETEDFIEVESDAAEMLNFEVDRIPGLLQTEDYTRALVHAIDPAARDDTVDRRVALRVERQRRLFERKLTLWAIVGSPALDCPVGGVEVHRQQMKRLIDASEHPNVTMQVLPYDAGEHTSLGMPFALALFPDGDGAVIIEHLTGNVYLEDQSDVSRYSLAFRHLCASALPARESLDLVRRRSDDV
jgi:transcriptional regulator with XRE-family HTH domain